MDTLFYFLINFSAATGLANCGSGEVCDTGLPVAQTGSDQLRTALAIVFAIAGAVAVLMIVIAGFRFVTAQGNSQETAKARNTIIYALVGLMVAITAEGIVAFVLGRL